MTWQGGKLRRELGPVSAFARLKPLAKDRDDPEAALTSLANALSRFPTTVHLHIRLVSGEDGDTVEHWHVQGGSKTARAQRKAPKKPDVTIVMRPETWMQIAQGRLAPYDALYAGKLRVGGDLEAAKAIVQHLTDPAFPYRSPC